MHDGLPPHSVIRCRIRRKFPLGRNRQCDLDPPDVPDLPVRARTTPGRRFLPGPHQRNDEFRVRPRCDGHGFHPVDAERFIHEAQPVLPHGKFQGGNRGYPQIPFPLVDVRPGYRLDHFQRPHPTLHCDPETRNLTQRIGRYGSRDVPFLAEIYFLPSQRRGIQTQGRRAERGSILVAHRDTCRIRLDPHLSPLSGQDGISLRMFQVMAFGKRLPRKLLVFRAHSGAKR